MNYNSQKMHQHSNATAGLTLPSILRIYVVLPGGYSVPSPLYHGIHQQIMEVTPYLLQADTYTLEGLCGPEYWGQLDNGERRMAGRCMAHLVDCAALPMTVARTKHEYPVNYRLI